MKVLFVGDVHNHQYIFDDVARLDKIYNFDRVIFLGDYVDDWMTDNNDSLKTLNKVIELKKSNLEKYSLCLGNHEVSYLGYPCSGHRYELEDAIQQVLTENIGLFDYYVKVNLGEKDFICSHAGFTNDYICNVIDKFGEWEPIMEKLNIDKIKNLIYLSFCSSSRGGSHPYSSFIWADKSEMLNNYDIRIIPNQIVGHSPVQTISNLSSEEGIIYFCDTHSTYRDGSKYGDKTYLIFDEDKFNVVH